MLTVVIDYHPAFNQSIQYKLWHRIIQIVAAICGVVDGLTQFTLFNVQVSITLVFNKPLNKVLPFLLQSVHYRALHYHPRIDALVIGVLNWWNLRSCMYAKVIFGISVENIVVDDKLNSLYKNHLLVNNRPHLKMQPK